MRRRRLFEVGLALGAGALAACGRDQDRAGAGAPGNGVPSASGRMPSIFLAHGAPPLLDDAGWMGELAGWAAAMPRPAAVLMISAHWEEAPVTLGATRTVPLVYDFSGFPERYYRLQYPSPGAPDLAARVRALLGAATTRSDERRGLDHGAWVPLMAMYPAADVPVVQMSLPTLEPAPLLALGQRLAPLRDEGVLIVGSGFITHNLRAMRAGPPPAWASEFDAWTADALERRDLDALVQYRDRAPGVRMALPTHEHYVPLLAALGAGGDAALRFSITGFAFGSASKRSVQIG